MTPDDVKRLLARIRATAGDDAMAHAEEDGMRAAVLKSIADGTSTDPAECARLAISSDKIEFRRWHE